MRRAELLWLQTPRGQGLRRVLDPQELSYSQVDPSFRLCPRVSVRAGPLLALWAHAVPRGHRAGGVRDHEYAALDGLATQREPPRDASWDPEMKILTTWWHLRIQLAFGGRLGHASS
jgi:hypothetical protein